MLLKFIATTLAAATTTPAKISLFLCHGWISTASGHFWLYFALNYFVYLLWNANNISSDLVNYMLFRFILLNTPGHYDTVNSLVTLGKLHQKKQRKIKRWQHKFTITGKTQEYTNQLHTLQTHFYSSFSPGFTVQLFK